MELTKVKIACPACGQVVTAELTAVGFRILAHGVMARGACPGSAKIGDRDG